MGCAGTRTASVSRPALQSSEIEAPLRRGSTSVRGPGQKCRASSRARASNLTALAAASAACQCTMSGLKRGRPFAAKIAATARSLRASAPRP